MNHTGQSETILPDWRDGRIRELELENEQLQRHIGSLVTQIHGERQRPEGNATVADMLREAICPHCDFATLPKGDSESTGCEWCDARRAVLSPQGTPPA